MKKLLVSVLIAASALSTMPAEAAYGGARGSFSSSRSYSSSRSFSTPSRPVFRAPSVPVYRAPPTTVIRSAPTVIHQSSTVVQRSGGGFFSSMFGSMAGTGLMMWLFGNHNQPQQPAPQAQAPAAPASVPASAPVVTK